ncbi:MAG TPA: hypothetical protein VNI02_02230, partial [Blastocatellia bacterium]|nr:hypothetical protein [Blastocatellia bacterium]
MRLLAFLDLDLTLFDYSTAREEATYAALQKMEIGCNVTDALEVMNSVLVPYGDLLADVGLPNFRREWKAPELFAVLEVLNKTKNLPHRVSRLGDLLADITRKNHGAQGFWDRQQNRELLHHAVEESGINEIKSELDEILRDPEFQDRINVAVAAFDEYLRDHAVLSKGVDRLLRALADRGFENYIVSEGDDRIQNEKISILGLARHMDGVYVSSACCQSERLLDWLWRQAIKLLEAEKVELTDAHAAIYDEVIQYSNKTATLFRKVLHTVLLPEQERADFYARFGWLGRAEWRAQEPVYILLFGDRYDKDLLPAIEAFKNVVTVRLLSGKYRQEYLEEALGESRLPEPTATVESVMAA